MNGSFTNQHVPVSDAEPQPQPLISIAPIRITGAQIWAAILAIPASLAALTSYGLIYKPAKDTDLTALTAIVQTIQTAQKETSDSVRRLTEAVDNLSGIVVKLPKPKSLTGGAKLR